MSAQSSTAGASLFEAFKAGMRDLGWHEGRNVEYRPGYGDGRIDQLDAVAKELVTQNVSHRCRRCACYASGAESHIHDSDSDGERVKRRGQ